MFQITYQSKNSKARTGKIETRKGIVETPSFIFKTYNLKKILNEDILQKINTQIIKSDAFEIWKILSDEAINFSTGIHDILKWQKPILTDSGSLEILKLKEIDPKNNIIEILNSGINFFNHQKGIEDYFDAEKSLKIQEELNADIMTTFDLPINWHEDLNIVLEQTEKSHNWQIRFLEAKTSNQQVLGVIGGGIFDNLIELSIKFLNKLNLDGIIINNFLNQPEINKVLNILEIINKNYPENKIKYAKNVQSIQDLFQFIKNGIDIFETDLPYKKAKNGLVFIENKIINLNQAQYSNDESILDETCDCPICEEGRTKKEIYWQLKLNDSKGFENIIIHNIYFINKLMHNIREAIKQDKIEELEGYFKN